MTEGLDAELFFWIWWLPGFIGGMIMWIWPPGDRRTLDPISWFEWLTSAVLLEAFFAVFFGPMLLIGAVCSKISDWWFGC